MIYDICARIKDGQIVYSPKHRKGESKGYRLRLKERVEELNQKGSLENKPKTPIKEIQLKLFY